MKIYAVRHGLTESNKEGVLNMPSDEPLIEEGIKEIEELRNTLPGDIKAIYSSPLLRARQTTEIIDQRFQLPIIYRDELKEVDWGTLRGKSFKDIEDEHGSEYGKERYAHLQFDLRPFGGEAVESLRARVHTLVDYVKEFHKEGPILFVAHGGVLRMLEHDYNQKFISNMPNGLVVEVEV
jgi:broad specificity phosphatase PhoE